MNWLLKFVLTPIARYLVCHWRIRRADKHQAEIAALHGLIRDIAKDARKQIEAAEKRADEKAELLKADYEAKRVAMKKEHDDTLVRYERRITVLRDRIEKDSAAMKKCLNIYNDLMKKNRSKR